MAPPLPPGPICSGRCSSRCTSLDRYLHVFESCPGADVISKLLASSISRLSNGKHCWKNSRSASEDAWKSSLRAAMLAPAVSTSRAPGAPAPFSGLPAFAFRLRAPARRPGASRTCGPSPRRLSDPVVPAPVVHIPGACGPLVPFGALGPRGSLVRALRFGPRPPNCQRKGRRRSRSAGSKE